MADLADDIRDLISLLDQALQRTATGPDPMPPWLLQAREAGRMLFERVCAGPHGRYLGGFLLSREEFFLLASRGLASVDMPWGDEYDVFRMFHYEDSDQRGYINPSERPRVPGTVRVRLGIPPEEIAWERLRPEQRDFFERHLPQVAGRFARQV